MAYESLQDFFDVTGLIAAGSIHEYEMRGATYEGIEHDSPEAEYRKLITAARVVGPIALENLVAQADDQETPTTVPKRDVQIVEADPEKIMQIKSSRPVRGWFNKEKHDPSYRITEDIIKSYKEVSTGWTIVNEEYEPTDENPFTAEIVALGSDGELSLTRGMTLGQFDEPEYLEGSEESAEQESSEIEVAEELAETEADDEAEDIDVPEEEMLKIPMPIDGISQHVSIEWDEILWDGHAVGPFREKGYDLITKFARSDVAFIGEELMKFVVDAGLDEVLAERARSIS